MLRGKREPHRSVPARSEVLAQPGSGLHHLPKSPSRAAEPMGWDRGVAAKARGAVLGSCPCSREPALLLWVRVSCALPALPPYFCKGG